MRKVEYKNYCVAFLDILGFKNLIATEDAKTIHNVFTNIRHGKKLIVANSNAASKLDKLNNIKLYFFSDSIVCAIPMEEPLALELVSSHCMLLQHALWYYGLPVWLRGGIACGELYCGQSEVFGPALIEAYSIENQLAQFPRVVMTEETYQKGVANNGGEDIPFIVKEDDLRMVEIFRFFDYKPEREKVIAAVHNALQTQTEPRILAKYQWIKDRYNLSV